MITVVQARRDVSRAKQNTISPTPEEQLDFWDALNATPTESISATCPPTRSSSFLGGLSQ